AARVPYREARIAAPARFAPRRNVISAYRFRPVGERSQGVRSHVSDELGASRRTDLIVDDRKPIALRGRGEHRAQEIAPADAEDPLRPQDQMPAARFADALLAFPLGPSVNVDR